MLDGPMKRGGVHLAKAQIGKNHFHPLFICGLSPFALVLEKRRKGSEQILGKERRKKMSEPGLDGLMDYHDWKNENES